MDSLISLNIFIYLFIYLFISFIYLFIYQEPTNMQSRKKLMRWVCAKVGLSEEGVYCKIIFL